MDVRSGVCPLGAAAVRSGTGRAVAEGIFRARPGAASSALSKNMRA